MNNKVKAVFIVVVLFVITTLSLTNTYSAVPGGVNYQGRYKENGAYITGTRAFKFKITDATGVTLYWESSIVNLTVTQGLFNYVLPVTDASFDWTTTTPYIKVYAGPQGSTLESQLLEELPLAQVQANAYAFYTSSTIYSPTTGNGTGGYLARFVLRDTLGNSIIKENGSSIGIGATAANSKLEVEGGVTHTYPIPGTTYGTMTLSPSGTDGDSASLTARAVTGGVLTAGAQAGIYVQSSSAWPGTKMYFGNTNVYATGSQARLMIDHQGSVGLGTTVPGSKFTLDGGNLVVWNLNDAMVYSDDGTTYKGYMGTGRNKDLTIVSKDSGSSWLRFGANKSSIAFFTSSNAEAQNTPQLVISSTSFVGIGVTSPQFKIETSGATNRTKTWGIQDVLFLGDHDTASPPTFSVSCNEIYVDTANAWANIAGKKVLTMELRNTGIMDLYGGQTDGFYDHLRMLGLDAPANMVRFPDYDGKVGIGTTAPTERLEVAGNIDFYDTTADSRRIFFGATGVAAPAASSAGEKIQLYGTAGTVAASDYAMGIEGSTMWFNTAFGYKWYINSTQEMVYDTNGNLGIGVASPVLKLDANGWVGSSDYGATGGWRLGRGPENASDDTWVYLSRADSNARQDLAIGALWAGGAVRFGTADDIAEILAVDPAEKVELGDLVITDPGQGLRLVKTKQAYDSRIAGVVSSYEVARIVIGGNGIEAEKKNVSKQPIAIAGPVRVKVNLENGPINKGDLLTSSSVPGVAMRCPIETDEQKLKSIGVVVGKALEKYDGSDGEKNGVIIAMLALQ
ncbi:MAG: hypothetical protein WC955_01040 [Elusimicrobiota bacterium]